MRRRTGNIQDRGTSFRIRYTDTNGLRHHESFKTRDEAERELAIRLGELAKGLPVSSKPNTVLFGELADDVLTDYELNGYRSFDDAETRFRLHLIPVFGRRKASQITTAQINHYKLQRKNEGAKPGTINRELELMRHTLKMALDGNKLLHAPKVAMLKEDNVRKGFFTRPEIERLTSFLPGPLANLVWFGFLTGWRLGEIQGLKWSTVDFARGEIRLDPGSTKNGEGRVFPMSTELGVLLERTAFTALAKSAKANRAVVPPAGMSAVIAPLFGKQVFGIGSFRKSWKTACYKAGIPCTVEPVKKGGKKGAVKILACSRTFHDLRRSAVREWIRNGMPEKTAMLLSGHLTRSVLDRYNIVSEADLLEAVRYLEKGQTKGQEQRRTQENQ